MAANVTWDNAFQAVPDDTDAANQGANAIRTFKEAVNERFELEMNFRDGTKPFIKAGIASVVNVNATATIAGLSSPSNGALAFDTTTKAFKYYASQWVTAEINHNNLGNLTGGDPHTQYLAKAGGTVTGNIAMGAGKTVDTVDVSVLKTDFDDHAANDDIHGGEGGGGGNSFGSWVPKANNTDLTATTDGVVVAYGRCTNMYIRSGPNYRCRVNSAANSHYHSLTCPVANGDSYEVVTTANYGTIYVWWLPLA